MSEHIDNLQIKVVVSITQLQSYGSEKILARSERVHGGSMLTGHVEQSLDAMIDSVRRAALVQLALSEQLRKNNSQQVVDDVRQGS